MVAGVNWLVPDGIPCSTILFLFIVSIFFQSVTSCYPFNIFSWPSVVIDLQWMQFRKLASSFKYDFAHGHGSTKRYTFYHRLWYLSSNTASKLSQTPAQTNWLRTTPCLRNTKQFGKKVHNHVPFDINSSKPPSSFCLHGRNMPSQCSEIGMDPQMPVIVFDTPKLSYEEALKFCPDGLCKFYSFFSSCHKNNLGAPLTVADLCQFGFHRYNESELFNDLLAWTSIESEIQGPHDSRNNLTSASLNGDSYVGDIVMLVTLWWWLIWDVGDRIIMLATFFVMLVIFSMY